MRRRRSLARTLTHSSQPPPTRAKFGVCARSRPIDVRRRPPLRSPDLHPRPKHDQQSGRRRSSRSRQRGTRRRRPPATPIRPVSRLRRLLLENPRVQVRASEAPAVVGGNGRQYARNGGPAQRGILTQAPNDLLGRQEIGAVSLSYVHGVFVFHHPLACAIIRKYAQSIRPSTPLDVDAGRQ